MMKTTATTPRVLFLLMAFASLYLAGCDELCDCDSSETEIIAELDGAWIRVESNNPTADGIVVKLVGNDGVITDKAGSNFSVGDVKWQNISSEGGSKYVYDELGSDGNYYESTMERDADTLRIMVGSSGAGNQQRWVKDGTYVPGENGPSTTQPISGRIEEETLYRNGPAIVDYRIEGVLDITAPLTFEAGAVIEMAENAGIGVFDNGSISAIGTDSEPIVIRGEDDIQGYWRGIHIETSSGNNVLRNVRIENAGSNYVYCCRDAASVFVRTGARVTLDNVHISNGLAVGLLIEGGVTIDQYTKLKIDSHRDFPANLHMEVLDHLDGEESDYSGNDKDYVYVPAYKLEREISISKLNVPYRLDGEVHDIVEKVTINSGVEMVFEESGGLGFYDSGALSILGTAAEPVIMRGLIDQRGFWRGISLETARTDNALNYLQLSNAGSNYVYCCDAISSINFELGGASMTNCTILDGAGNGISAYNGFEFDAFTDNTISAHSQSAVRSTFASISNLDLGSSELTGNGRDEIVIIDNKVDEETTLQAASVPYVISTGTVVDVTDRLNIRPGVDLVFEENAGLGVYDNGVLNAPGTSGKPIRFRGAVDIAGYWRGIHTETSSNFNRISNATIQNAGSNYVYCCNEEAGLVVKGGEMTVTNSTFTDNEGCGIYVYSAAVLNASGNSFSGNTEGEICD